MAKYLPSDVRFWATIDDFSMSWGLSLAITTGFDLRETLAVERNSPNTELLPHVRVLTRRPGIFAASISALDNVDGMERHAGCVRFPASQISPERICPAAIGFPSSQLQVIYTDIGLQLHLTPAGTSLPTFCCPCLFCNRYNHAPLDCDFVAPDNEVVQTVTSRFSSGKNACHPLRIC